jgi:hypothetical protein
MTRKEKGESGKDEKEGGRNGEKRKSGHDGFFGRSR